MKKTLITFILFGILISGLNLLTAFRAPVKQAQPSETWFSIQAEEDLKQMAFDILNTKCNVCHRKQNPFRVFSLKNMEKNATRIRKQVFIKKRMPKGNEIRLTKSEYETLEKWLKTQIDF